MLGPITEKFLNHYEIFLALWSCKNSEPQFRDQLGKNASYLNTLDAILGILERVDLPTYSPTKT